MLNQENFQARKERYQSFPSTDKQRIELYKGQGQSQEDLELASLYAPQTKSVYERPSIETTKSLGGWIENFASDWGEMIKGIGMILPTISHSLFDERDGIIPNIEHLPEIFNRTLPQESRPHSWLKDIPIIGDMDKFQIGRELLITSSQVIDATVEPYKDGILEAAYKHPFFLFLDATAVASVMGKGATTMARIPARSAHSAALREGVALGKTGKELSDYAMVAKTKVLNRAEAIGKGIAGAPYLPFTGPFKGTHKLLTGKLKDAMPGQMYSSFRKAFLIDELAIGANRIWGSFRSQMPLAAAKQLKAIQKDMGKLTTPEINFFWDTYFNLDKISQHLPDTSIAKELGQPLVSDARRATLKKAAEDYRRISLDQIELEKLEMGDLTKDKMKVSRASSANGWRAYRKAEAEIAREIAAGAKTEKKYRLFGEESLPKAHRDAIHKKYREEYLDQTKDSGKRHRADMMDAIDKLEDGAKEVPYLPFVQDRTFDAVEFIQRLAFDDFAEYKQWVAHLESRKMGSGAISMDPHVVMYKHIWHSQEVAFHKKAVESILKEYGQDLKAGKIPVEDGNKWVPFKHKFLLDHYLPAQGKVRTSIYRIYEKKVEDFRRLKPDWDDDRVFFESAKETLTHWGQSVDGQASAKAIQKQFRKFVDDPKNFDTQTWVPEQVMKLIEGHMAKTTGPMLVYQKGLNIFRFMALNMFPRFYINQMLGNATITLFSGGKPGAKGIVAMEDLAEATQNVFVQEPGLFAPWMTPGKNWYGNFLEWFQKEIEYPGRALAIGHKLEGLAQEARLLKTGKAAASAVVAQEDLLKVFLKDYRAYQMRGPREANIVNNMDTGFRKAQAQIHQKSQLTEKEGIVRKKLEDLKSEDGNFASREFNEKVGKVRGTVRSIRDQLISKEIGGSKHTPFIKRMDEILGDATDPATYSSLADLQDYLAPGAGALDDLLKSVHKKPEATELLRNMRATLNRNIPKMDRLLARDNFVRQTQRLKTRSGFFIDENGKVVSRARKDVLDHVLKVGQQDSAWYNALHGDPDLWYKTFGIKRNSKKSQAMVEEALKFGEEFHRLNNSLKRIHERLGKLDPVSMIKGITDDLAKVLPNEDIAKIRANMLDQSIKYMEEFFGNYNSMHPYERKIVRHLFPFWTFPKTMFKLMWRLPGLRPKTAGLWANFSKYMMDASSLDTMRGRFGNSMILGGDEDGNFVLARFNGWVPFEAAALGRFGNLPVMPRGMNLFLANPLVKMAVEYQVGHDLFTGRPWGDKAFMSNTGQKFEFDHSTGKFKMVTPQKDFEDGIYSLLPHWGLLREMIDPNYRTPKIGDEYIYDRNRIMSLGRLFGVGVSVTNPQKQKQIDNYYRGLILKKIRTAMRFRSTEERALARAMMEHLRTQGKRNGQGYVWTLNPPFY